jgi:hypothetical protein
MELSVYVEYINSLWLKLTTVNTYDLKKVVVFFLRFLDWLIL